MCSILVLGLIIEKTTENCKYNDLYKLVPLIVRNVNRTECIIFFHIKLAYRMHQKYKQAACISGAQDNLGL